MRGTVRAVVDEVNMMEELSDNHRHGDTREMILFSKDLETPWRELKGHSVNQLITRSS